ncbi:synaptic vesicular amine transporter-like [Sphaeramia orbicularis]|uniref:synaptic vesicular amine transporter-like n=1 Tax=Sphaeramia orbicularis TaxID=375764 RepID=UPI0011815EBB|nr:synaptic vesicular amine transporter-like [Sphaeramia orbicularis]
MGLLAWLRQEPQERKVVVVVVFTAFFLDGFLLSAVVPVLPSFLYSIDHHPIITGENLSSSTVGPVLLQSSGTLGSTVGPVLLQSSGTLSSTATPLQHSPAHKPSDPNCTEDRDQLDSENIKVGVLLASKPVVQLITNPFIGSLTDRIGYHIPLCTGFCVIFIVSTLFGFSSSFILLLLVRSGQGVGGSCLCVSGLGLAADVFKEDTERGRAIASSLSGLALGLMGGAPVGSALYQYVGKPAPFLFSAAMAALGGGLHFLIFKPTRKEVQREKGTPLLTLLRDPYILIAAGSVCLAAQAVATLEAALPLWMMKTMCPSQWLLGFVFLPDSLSYLIASNIFGSVAHKIGRWLCAFIGMILTGTSLISFGFCTNIYHVMVLNACIGFSVGIVDSTVIPLMGSLVDLRYIPVYGTVYAIFDVAVCLGFIIGPAFGGPIAASLDFPILVAIVGTVNILYAPLCVLLFRPLRGQNNVRRAGKNNHVFTISSE